MNITQKYQRFKLHLNTSQRKIIQYTTRRDIRIQSFPDIIPAVNQDPVNINLQNPKLLAARVENKGTQSLG